MIVKYDVNFVRTLIDHDQIVPGGVFERRTHKGWQRGIVVSVVNNEVTVLLSQGALDQYTNMSGDSFIDVGYVYAPYVPIQVTQNITMSVKVK